jgi:hypothetical protein
MNSSERKIVFTNDLDGVHFKVPPPFNTAQQLLRRRLTLPETDATFEKHNLPDRSGSFLFNKWTIFCHKISPVNKEALAGLEIFRQTAEENNRQLKIAALSGREKYKHPMTKKRLSKSGHMEFFSDLHLNQGGHSYAWKESVVKGLIEEGLSVVHIDDDLRSGLSVARVNEDYPDEERVFVYMLRNISNGPKLLKWSKVEIPSNMMFVRSFKEAASDFSERLVNRKL